MKPKVVLAYSGGLDTSYCVKYLKHEKGLEVHTVLVNTGGYTADELKKVSQKALDLGAESHVNLDELEAYYQDIIKYLVFGNVLKNSCYPLSVSAERVHQAKAIAFYAKKIGADYLAHGSTGAGNDQVRFDLMFQLLAPELKILTPIREQQLSREQEISYLKQHGVEMQWEKAKYSINKGLWGTSVGGAETLNSHTALPEHAYPSQLTELEPKTVELLFEKGELIGIDGMGYPPVAAIQKLEQLASPYAIGRDIHVGDTIIGIKGRVGFEAAAALITIKAHQLLEKHTLSKWQMQLKDQLASTYGMFLHEGQFLEPSMRDIEVFFRHSQEKVSGSVSVGLAPYRFVLQGVVSKHDLMNSDFGDYGEMNKQWSATDVEGYTKIVGNSMKLYQQVNGALC